MYTRNRDEDRVKKQKYLELGQSPIIGLVLIVSRWNGKKAYPGQIEDVIVHSNCLHDVDSRVEPERNRNKREQSHRLITHITEMPRTPSPANIFQIQEAG
ncbi:hypothetical protein N7517_007844 [Penicillium concentricum]|uniref:Uncharacterized protein n=1 Tax=Penicillium concentricum TaxID=293559 RepID=A0A9W9SGP2_9EURO|nr:uncharacterized protein N7517_007844 [Penicillium concentricum]KAJ5375838.1 hypothetical protein N7517_007844 [Penicillium concentricum]